MFCCVYFNEICCDSINGTWNGNECIDLPTGVWISGNEKITASNELEIENFQSITADLEAQLILAILYCL